jgi:hypothetical protein
MADSVTGVPVYVLADLKVANQGANAVGESVDNEEFTITTPGTNATKVSAAGLLATSFTTSGSGVGGTVVVTVGVSGEVTKAIFSGGSGYVATDTITIDEIDDDAMDTDCVLTIDTIQALRSRWNSRAAVAVSDHPADGGDGNERTIFVSDSLNNVWRAGRAKLGGQTGNEDGPQIVIPE